MNALFDDVEEWLKRPYTGGENMDVLKWALFAVLLTSVSFLWTRVLKSMQE